MVAAFTSLIVLMPLLLGLQGKASPVAQESHGMLKRYDQDTARYMQEAGCFKDEINNRIFAGRPEHDIPIEKITVKACYAACLANNWEVAGLQNGNECWCHTQAPAKDHSTNMGECDRPCSGDDKETCGGANRMSVWTFYQKNNIESFTPEGSFTPVYTYTMPERTGGSNNENPMVVTVFPAYTIEVVAPAQVTTSVTPTQGAIVKRFDETTAMYMYDYGCFKDDNLDERVFEARPKLNIHVENTTVAACNQACLAENFPVAGLQNGNECWCNQLPPAGQLLADSADCNTPCTGDETSTCEGANRMEVWALGEFDDLPHEGEYTPVATYTKPAWTGSLSSGAQLLPRPRPAKTVEVVRPGPDDQPGYEGQRGDGRQYVVPPHVDSFGQPVAVSRASRGGRGEEGEEGGEIGSIRSSPTPLPFCLPVVFQCFVL